MSLAPYLPALQKLARINTVDYQDEGTQRHLAALALPLDDVAGRAYAAALARLIRYAPESALLLIGQERRVRRYPDEPLETYRARVLGAWASWRLAGTRPGVELALAQAGYDATVMEHFSDPEHWAEFSVTVSPKKPLAPGSTWNQGAAWDDGGAWDYRIDAVPLGALVDLIREVKPAHARLRRLELRLPQHVWDGDGVWQGGRGLAQHLWGSLWGLPSIVFMDLRTNYAWDDPQNIVIYDLEEAHA